MTTPATPPDVALPPRAAREKLTLTVDQACDLIDDELEGFEKVSDEITDTSRWSINYLLVVKRLSDGRFFADGYGVGATESQDESPWQHHEPDFREVFPVEVVKIEYR